MMPTTNASLDFRGYACFDRVGGKWYARRTDHSSGRPRTIRLHRFILGPCAAPQIDHKNGDGLDNRRTNIRPCTVSQNRANIDRAKNNKAGFKGVHLHKRTGKWRAVIRLNKRSIHLGLFHDRAEAARAYNAAAAQYFGEFARLNIIPGGH